MLRGNEEKTGEEEDKRRGMRRSSPDGSEENEEVEKTLRYFLVTQKGFF